MALSRVRIAGGEEVGGGLNPPVQFLTCPSLFKKRTTGGFNFNFLTQVENKILYCTFNIFSRIKEGSLKICIATLKKLCNRDLFLGGG